jgi:hypothetical protein
LKKYNLTIELWDALFNAQGRCCKICGSIESGGKGWATDHDHVTGKFRGILCNACNNLLGFGRDSVIILQAAIAYIKNN